MLRLVVLSVLFSACLTAQHQWKNSRKVNGDDLLGFHFALYNRNEHKLEQIFFNVSDPKLESYGDYMTIEEIADLVAPSMGIIKGVEQFLHNQGGRNIHTTLSRDWIYAEFTAAESSQLFQTEFCFFTAGKLTLARSCNLRYTMPVQLSGVVQYISGLTQLPQIRTVRVVKDPLFGNDPATLRKLYNIPQGTKGTDKKNSQAVTGFLDQWYSPSDLQAFFRTYSPHQDGEIMHENGTNRPQQPGIEANLDVQYIMSMGDGVTSWFYSDDRKNKINNQEPWASFLAKLADDSTAPLLFSMSYGDQENSLTKTYTDKVNTELKKLGTRGISMLAASGDDGSGCENGKFQPNYPGTSPFLTAVGGTTGATNPEAAAGLSAGGFSNLYGRADAPWQKAAVEAYMKQQGLPDKKYYNATGRGYPDVAAVAENVPICDGGNCGLPVAGTSCASPTFSGIVGLLNDARLSAGKPSLGFLNPLFYQLAAGSSNPFNDITEGAGSGGGCGRGWPATKGWDAVTGLGSPDYQKLVAAVKALSR